jgi:hypothetical protein
MLELMFLPEHDHQLVLPRGTAAAHLPVTIPARLPGTIPARLPRTQPHLGAAGNPLLTQRTRRATVGLNK